MFTLRWKKKNSPFATMNFPIQRLVSNPQSRSEPVSRALVSQSYQEPRDAKFIGGRRRPRRCGGDAVAGEAPLA